MRVRTPVHSSLAGSKRVHPPTHCLTLVVVVVDRFDTVPERVDEADVVASPRTPRTGLTRRCCVLSVGCTTETLDQSDTVNRGRIPSDFVMRGGDFDWHSKESTEGSQGAYRCRLVGGALEAAVGIEMDA